VIVSHWFASLAGLAQATAATGFTFLDPGPLLDGELELVAPDSRWINDMLASCQHPMTQLHDAEHARTSRTTLEQFLRNAPAGREPGEERKEKSPSYHFWMRLDPASQPPIPMAGTVSLRIGQTPDLVMYFGHIGYNVYPVVRGHHYAQRACQLVFRLARQHGINPLWITTDPENAASRRTCERLGGALVDTVDVPRDHVLYSRGQRRKCRYRFDL
jgi:predicted acetyltransferase